MIVATFRAPPTQMTLHLISSTLGDVVNLSRKADMVSTVFFLDNESLFLFGVVYHVYTTRRPFDVSVSYIYIYIYIYIV